jgi:hypothetical protein
MELEHSNDENQEGMNETAAKRRKSTKTPNKGDDSIEIKSECSSFHNDGGEHGSILKEKTTRKINVFYFFYKGYIYIYIWYNYFFIVISLSRSLIKKLFFILFLIFVK